MKDSCYDCGVTWVGEEIPDHLMSTGDYRSWSEAEEAAKCYGWTAENGRCFSINVTYVQYGYDSPNHYDGASEVKCTVCGARRGRWSGKTLSKGEEELRYGGK